MDIYEEIVKMKNSKQEGVVITVVNRKGHGPATVGKKLLVSASGEMKGTVGGGALEYMAVEKAKEVLKEKKHAMVSYDFTGENVTKADVSIDMICGGVVTLYFEYLQSSPQLVILGAGHVGKCLSNLVLALDYRTIIVEDREEIAKELHPNHEVRIGAYEEIIESLDILPESYIVVAGYTHEIEYRILKTVFKYKKSPKYIGLLASERKARIILQRIEKELGCKLDFGNVHAPVGLDIGGESPEEIAISILAEIQAIRYQRLENKHLTKSW